MTAFEPPTADWFDPHPDMPHHGVWIGYSGRISGYVARWDAADHPPAVQRGTDNFAVFHRTEFRTADGTALNVAPLRITSRRPPAEADPEMVDRFYTAQQVGAWVRAGEDDRGLWVAGVLTHPSLRDLVECGDLWRLSGDWRSFGSSTLRLCAVSVQTPDTAQGLLW